MATSTARSLTGSRKPHRGQCNAAESFAGASRANRDESVKVAARCRLSRVDLVGDFYQLVGIGSVVAVQADGGCDRVDRGCAVVVDDADDVAASARRGLDRRRIIRDAIRHAKVESILDHILAHPGLATRRCGADPLLKARSRKRT